MCNAVIKNRANAQMELGGRGLCELLRVLCSISIHTELQPPHRLFT